jgi:hypothetical protein
MATSFSNDQGTGTVTSDGFAGPGALTSIANSGPLTATPTVVAAAGASQATSTLIGNFMVVVVTASTSAQGIRFPSAATGRMLFLFTTGTKAPLAYPFLHDKIGTGASNIALQLTANKGGIFMAKDATTWLDILGA